MEKVNPVLILESGQKMGSDWFENVSSQGPIQVGDKVRIKPEMEKWAKLVTSLTPDEITNMTGENAMKVIGITVPQGYGQEIDAGVDTEPPTTSAENSDAGPQSDV